VVTADAHQTYEVRVVGHLDDRWAATFGELTIARCDDGTCTLTGTVADQAQLHGILTRLRDIGATLVSLRALDGEDERAYDDGVVSADPGSVARR
jgi:hypothetical protein